jgi:hypothetical protein
LKVDLPKTAERILKKAEWAKDDKHTEKNAQ